MIKFKVKAGRAAEVARKLGNFRAAKVMADEFETHEESLLKRLQTYPAERPGQRYVRQENLKEAWNVDTNLTGNGAVITAENPLPYAPLVQDENEQAWMHRDRWMPAQDIIKEEEPAIKAGIKARAEKVLK